MSQHLTFILDKQKYGFTIESVREINRMTQVTSVPQMPSHVEGVMNLRGKVVPVIDLRKLLKTAVSPHTKHSCIIVLEHQNTIVGAIVDAVADVVDIDPEQIEPNPSNSSDARFLMGIGKHSTGIVLLLDTTRAMQLKGAVDDSLSTAS